MSVVRIKLNRTGVRNLLRSTEVQQDLTWRANEIANAANAAAGLDEGFEFEVTLHRNRAHAQVWTATPEAMAAEAAHRTLTQSIDAGRG